jgi:Fe-S-cluster-containing dehydrogenase component/DMSO reductase anchor subunit
MADGFIFNHSRCVNCGACGAACTLENGWIIQPRKVYTYNTDALMSLPVINLSLACNHCETAVCLDGCPSSSLYRDSFTSAVVIDENKCIGCRYCQWNCPYDAPKFDEYNRIIGKCNLCYSELIAGRLPACTTACPTGALIWGKIEPANEKLLTWLPDKNLNPSLSLYGTQNDIPLRIIPEKNFEPEISISEDNNSALKPEWILIVFTFLVTLSVSSLVSSLFKGKFPDPVILASVIVLAGIVSLLHLGKKSRAWRAVSNLRTSPLSREIALFVIYSLLSISALIFHLPMLLILSSIAGLMLLVAIDAVYIYADKSRTMIFHSGQTFVSGLLIVSFLTGNILPFIFIALFKLAAFLNNMLVNKTSRINFSLRFLSISLLLITGTSLISGLYNGDSMIISLFLTGELLDRILYYIDFDPVNINRLIYKNITAAKNEKERG